MGVSRDVAGRGANSDVAIVIAARDEAERIKATVAAAKTISEIVIVVDDGSRDGTAPSAREAGAIVVSHPRNRGKGAAMTTGAAVAAGLDQRAGRTDDPRHLLFLDGDLGESAKHGAELVGPVRSGAAHMTIGILPRQARAGGGFGFVVRLSRAGIRHATGFEATQPLSGQRCLTRAAYEAAQPLAHGWGVETGLTIDLLRKGWRVLEVEADFHHRATGRDLGAQLHRARQYAHVATALAARGALPVRFKGPFNRKAG